MENFTLPDYLAVGVVSTIHQASPTRKPEQISCMWSADLAAGYYQDTDLGMGLCFIGRICSGEAMKRGPVVGWNPLFLEFNQHCGESLHF